MFHPFSNVKKPSWNDVSHRVSQPRLDDLTDVNLVSDDTYWRLDWSSNWGYFGDEEDEEDEEDGEDGEDEEDKEDKEGEEDEEDKEDEEDEEGCLVIKVILW